jgi:RNA polymerase sigma-70 factor, ECF subfamily
MDDISLIKAIAKKDNHAFKMLVERYQHMVVNLAFKFTQNKQDSEDLAQEVFFTVWKEAKTYRGQAQISTWIYRITTNKALNFLRKHKKEKLSVSDESLGQISAKESSVPDRVLEAVESKKILYDALEQLPEKLRIPFMFNKLDGLSYKDIANQMGLSVSNIETRIHRAKKQLQNILLKILE